jgi:hypothetical protein
MEEERQSVAVMGSGAWSWSAEQGLELEREMSCEEKRENE